MKPLLVVIAGPTASGKTNLAINLAKELNCNIISSDSRQFYKELKIGTAPPSSEQLNLVKHYFIGHLSVNDYYNVSKYEQEVISLFDNELKNERICILTGGSGLYINAVCEGIDEMPDHDPELRKELIEKLDKEGIESLRLQLKKIDPKAYSIIDIKNKNRVLRAVEMNLLTGKTLDQSHVKKFIQRPFQTLKIAINLPRDILYSRINERVDIMIAQGLVNEAKNLYKDKDLNALNTVGYKELFAYFDGLITLNEAIKLIKSNSRKYAKRQTTWFKRNNDYIWFDAGDFDGIKQHILTTLNQ